jgi:spore germination protein GerM
MSVVILPAAARRLAAAFVVAVLGLTAACGIPADDHPRAISKDQIPGRGGEGQPDSTAVETQPAVLYFTARDGDRSLLVPVERPVPVGSSSPTLVPATVLETLLSGAPSEEQENQGLGTAIPAGTALASQPALDEDGILTVDLNENIFDVQSPGSQLAFGQIVCTADALGQVDGVRFEVAGDPQSVPMGDTENTDDPLTCDAYTNLLQPAPGE